MFYNICKMYVNGIIRHKILGSTPTSGTTSFFLIDLFRFTVLLFGKKNDCGFAISSTHKKSGVQLSSNSASNLFSD